MRRAATLVVVLALGCAQLPPADSLAGTSWQLVKFQGGDGAVLTPDDRSKYTLAFNADGSLNARIDCNRGRGPWKSAGKGQVELGPMALTRAMCPPGSLHDRIVKQLPYVRSYLVKGGNLHLALMADGGIYEFEPTQLAGSAIYRERMALPPGAVFEATLEDVSKADAKAEVIGRARLEQPGNPPIAFRIPYDAARIEPRQRYAVRARIVVGERLFFITDQAYPVLTGGHGGEVKLMLRRVGGSVQAGNEPLEGTYWKLVELGGAAVDGSAHLILHRADKRVSGSGGCNKFSGGYQLDGERLSFGRTAGTMMACAAGMDIEQRFFAALGRTAGARVEQQWLDLVDAGGAVVARFEAVHLR